MNWNVELEATCSALGTFDGSRYLKDDDCLECVKDLIRFLRRDDDSHTLRRSLGQIGVVKTDLIPILRDYHNEEELFDMCLRLMVSFTFSPYIDRIPVFFYKIGSAFVPLLVLRHRA